MSPWEAAYLPPVGAAGAEVGADVGADVGAGLGAAAGPVTSMLMVALIALP